jgi:6-phosphogluconolactonase (cycloisomerase 2 family)
LTSLSGFPYALLSCDYVVADQTGTYLYARVGTNIIGYSIDATTGALEPLTGFPIAVGANANSISIDPTNQFLYVANGSAGTMTGLELNATTGELVPMPGSPFNVGKSADFIATF